MLFRRESMHEESQEGVDGTGVARPILEPGKGSLGPCAVKARRAICAARRRQERHVADFKTDRGARVAAQETLS